MLPTALPQDKGEEPRPTLTPEVTATSSVPESALDSHAPIHQTVAAEPLLSTPQSLAPPASPPPDPDADTLVPQSVEPSTPDEVISPPALMEETEGADEDSVFLKQNGQIYMVRDWETLKQWIKEGRVDKNDLVSQGGVRWEPIGGRSDLATTFGGEELADFPTAPDQTPFPFAENPFGAGQAPDLGWHDDDTEGIPTGLPPLPTEEPLTSEPAPSPWDPAQSPPPPALLDDHELPGPASTPLPAPEPISQPPVVPLAVPSPSPAVSPPPAPETLQEAPAPAPDHSISGTPADDGSWSDLLAAEDPDGQATAPASPPREGEQASTEQVVDLDLDFEEEWDDPATEQGNSNLLYGAAALAVLLLTAAVLYWVFAGPAPAVTTRPELPAPVEEPVKPPPAPAEVKPTPAPPEPTPVEPAPVEPAPVEPAPVEPAPAPAPVAPKPTAPRGPSAKSFIKKGWDTVESDPATAAASFERALALSPSNEDARYGLGYALLERDPAGAAKHLCRVREAKDPDIRQDVLGLIAGHNLSCN